MIGRDGPHVAPEAVVLIGVEALAGRKELRDDVLAEVVLGLLVDGILAEGLDQKLGIEDVDAHGGQVGVRLVGLLGELLDALVLVLGDDAEAGCLLPGHGHDGDGQVRLVTLVVLEHLLVVHVVELVTREDQDEVRIVLLDEADVLRDRIGGAGVPRTAGLRRVRGEDRDSTVALVQVPGGAGTQVGVEQVRPVLGQHADRVDARVGAVRQREVDDAILATERDGRLGDVLGEDAEPAALPAGKKHRDAFLLAHKLSPFIHESNNYYDSICQISAAYSRMVRSLEK